MKREMFKDKQIVIAEQNIKEKNFWINQLSGELVKSSFPYDNNPVAGQQNSAAVLRFDLTDQLYAKLMESSGQSPYKLHVILTAGIILLLSKYSGNRDIIVSTPIYKPDIEGKFINTVLPLRVQTGVASTFREMLKQVSKTITEASDHQNYPIEVLLDRLNIPICENEPSLLDTAIVVKNIHNPSHIQPANSKIIFSFLAADNCIKGELSYYSNYYVPTTVKGIITHLEHLLKKAVFKPDHPIAALDILTEEERNRLLYDWNHTQIELEGDKSIDQLFEKQAAKTPHHIVLVAPGFNLCHEHDIQHISYNELNQESQQLGCRLREKGIRSDTIAAVMMKSSIEMIVGILAILKAGGAYLPIDPGTPEKQTRFILKDNQVKILLKERSTVGIQVEEIKVIDVGNVCRNESWCGDFSPGKRPLAAPSNLALVLYAGHPNGIPRGVMIEHRNIYNLIRGIHEAIYSKYDENLDICLVSSSAVPLSLIQIFGTLILGYTLKIVTDHMKLNGSQLCQFYKKHKIDISDGTHTHMRLMLENSNGNPLELNVKNFIIGGGILQKELTREFLHKFKINTPNIIQVYGNIESSTAITVQKISAENITGLDYFPIGRPMLNQEVYIIDPQNAMLPPGIQGELCTTGAGIARGYLNQPELTAQRFGLRQPGGRFLKKLPPWSPRKNFLLTHLAHPLTYSPKYKTGDLARWLPDGTIELLGKTNRRVILKVTPIQLEKIELMLLKHAKIKEAAVILKKDENTTPHLCAYFVSEEELTAPTLREYMSGRFPVFLIPTSFTQLDRIPRTIDGKINWNALQEDETRLKIKYDSPRNIIEEKLKTIWIEVLEIDQENIRIDADFFQLGGQSLQAIMMASKIHEEFNISIPIQLIFELSTIIRLAEYIKGTKKTGYSYIELAEKKEYYMLSPGQKRLYFIQQMDLKSTGYNVTQIVRLQGNLDREKLEKAYKQLIKRHETLRTSLEVVEDVPVQRIHPHVEFALGYHDLSGKSSNNDEERKIIHDFVRAFDLSQAPLLRVGLIKRSEFNHILMVDLHHIISDATTRGIILKELIGLYEAEELPGLKTQYKDYSEWLNSGKQKQAIKKQEEYWLGQFKGEIPLLNLPTDYPRVSTQSSQGNIMNFSLGKEETQKLRILADEENATIYMVLLAIYNIFLSKICGQEDIVVGTPVVGRPHVDLENIIGIFINTLALRNYPQGHQTFKEFVSEVKTQALNAFENQMYPFEELVDKLSIIRDIDRNPLFDTVFLLQLQDSSNVEKRTYLNVLPYEHDIHTDIFELTLQTLEGEDNLFFVFTYKSNLYKKETIAAFINYFKEIVSQVIVSREIELKDISLTSKLKEIDTNIILEEEGDFTF
jgi:amino acid adenylation domain-containing protein